jgi:hypothetical protein
MAEMTGAYGLCPQSNVLEDVERRAIKFTVIVQVANTMESLEARQGVEDL